MEKFTPEVLNELIGQKVKITDPQGNEAELTIQEVVSKQASGQEGEAFSVYLRGDESFHAPQGIYQLSHQAFAQLDLFLSPKSTTEYEIVVNRKRL